MPNYRRARHGSTFFFTLVTRDRLPVLCDAPVRRLLRQAIGELRIQRPFQIDAWVLLPDHLHCIWTLPGNDPDYSARWGWVKKEVTKRLRLVPGMAGTARPTLWQPRFWEHMIRDEADFAAHCDYIHFNPVKHGLARSPREWPWSTFHRFVSEGVYPKTWGGDEVVIPDGIGNE